MSRNGVRGFGPVSETLMMGRILRQCTKDYSPVLKFIHAETDADKKKTLWELYHSFKYFIDTWDGISAAGKQRRDFGKHAQYIWELMVKQEVGRKIFVVGICGITSGLDTTYFAYWPTIQGITPSEISMMKHQLEIWRSVANGTAVRAEPLSAEMDRGTIVAMTDDKTVSLSTQTTAVTIEADDNGTIVVDDDEDDDEDKDVGLEVEVDVEGLDTEAIKEDSKADDSYVTIEPVTSGIGTMEIDTTIATNDEDMAVDTPSPAQVMPRPNVNLGTIDDQWSDDEFFDQAARKIVTQSTPTEAEATVTDTNNGKSYYFKPIVNKYINRPRAFKYLSPVNSVP